MMDHKFTVGQLIRSLAMVNDWDSRVTISLNCIDLPPDAKREFDSFIICAPPDGDEIVIEVI